MVELHESSSSGAKESPYFTNTQGSSKLLRTSETATNSPYFFRSPASVHGSCTALGPIFATWTSADWSEMVENCVYMKSSSRASSERKRLVCDTCWKFAAEAMAHFHGCPQIAENSKEMHIEAVMDNAVNERRSCLELLGPQMERQVRHLCRNQCYLRAYGPCRDWWTLRQSLLDKTDRPLYRLLQCWTCKLDLPGASTLSSNHDNPDGTAIDDDGHNRPAKHPRVSESMFPIDGIERRDVESVLTSTKSIFHPKTVFVNRQTGKHYASASQVIRKICLDELVQPTQCQNEVQVQDLDSWDVQRPHRTRKGSSDKRDAIDLGTSKIMISSPLGLLEELFGDDPWRLLMSTILLNRTRRNQVDAVFSELLDRWPTPHALIEMAYGFENDDKILDELVNLIAPLGIKNRRAKGIIRFCQEYVDLVTRKQEHNGGSNVDANQGGNDAALEATRTNSTNEKCFGVEFQFTREEILNLYHCGDYCADAYQIFVQQNWDNLHPLDHALRAYVEWKQSQTVQ